MVVCAAGYQLDAVIHQKTGKDCRIFNNLLLVQLEIESDKASLNATAFAAMTCISGPP